MATTSSRRHQSHWKTTQGGIRPPRYATPPPIDRKQHVEPISPTHFTSSSTDAHFTHNQTNWNITQRDINEINGLGLAFSYQQPNGYDAGSISVNNIHSPVLDSTEWSPYARHAQLAGPQKEFSPAEAKERTKGHHRSGSTIDTLATVALATSPPFAHATPVDAGAWSRSLTPARNTDNEERPAKRARSEKLASPMVGGKKDYRPATSYVASYDSTVRSDAEELLNMRNDAELLLNLARPSSNNSHWASTVSFGPPATPRQAYVEPDQPPHSPLTPPILSSSEFPKPASPMQQPRLPEEETPNTALPEPQVVTEAPPITPESDPTPITTEVDSSQTEDEPITIEDNPVTNETTADESTLDQEHTTTEKEQLNGKGTDTQVPEQQDEVAVENAGSQVQHILESGEARELVEAPEPAQIASVASVSVHPEPVNPVLGAEPLLAAEPLVVTEPLSVSESSPKESKTRKKKDIVESICAKCNSTQLSVAGVEQNTTEGWIECNACNKWYHCFCVNLKEEKEVQSIDKYICADCTPEHGETTYVRKSSRARTMIDYAGLNEGVIQTSSETNEHLYSRALREGKMKCMPDNFARIRPELATIDNLEGMTGGWNRPIVIPAKWNPRSIRHAQILNLTERFDKDHSPSLSDYENNDIEEEDYMPNREYEEVVDVDQDCLDMVIPHGLTVPMVADLIGPEEKVVDVIDVKTQNGESKKWSMARWAEYYTSKEPNKAIRNVISLEVSKYKLGRLIRRPKCVRDMDILDHVWPAELISTFPAVQFYCLMSVADCYTDFHVDFGGSSVYYHIVRGKKTFFFVPPEEKNIRLYEDWCNSGQQHANFLGDLCTECRRVDLSEGDTMLIPAGWIHAVWTPEDSLVIGGNFLTRTNYEMQFRIWESEKKCKIEQKFRYPHFQKVMWFSALKYMEDDPIPETILQSFQTDSTYRYTREKPVWYDLNNESSTEPGTETHNARYYSQKEVHGLLSLRDYLRRTTLISAGHPVDGVTVKSREAVKRSMPKGYGDHSQLIRAFAIWVAWKSGNVTAPEWVNVPDQPLQHTVAAIQKHKKPEPPRVPPERQSARVLELAQAQADAQAEAEAQALLTTTPTPQSADRNRRRDSDVAIKEETPAKKPRATVKSSGLGPKRVACDACRKRRIKCEHKDQVAGEALGFASSIEVAPSIFGMDGAGSPNQSYRQSLGSYGEVTPLNGYGIVAPGSAGSFSATPIKKPGRSKACDECRKSKRRCVHDENGKVDPVKLQEPSKPRGSSGTKRPRISDEMPNKKAKRNSNVRDVTPAEAILVGQAQSALAQAGLTNGNVFDENMIDPALMDQGSQSQSGYYTAEGDQYQEDETTNQAIAALALQAQTQIQVSTDVDSMLDPRMFAALESQIQETSNAAGSGESQELGATEPRSVPFASPPNSLLNESDIKDYAATAEANEETITRSIESNIDLLDAGTSLHTPQSASRHSSRQPKHPPTSAASEQTTAAAPVSNGRESSGSNDGTVNSGEVKPSASIHATSPMTATGANPRGRSGSAKAARASIGSSDADEESMRLIREIQAQERGLRRRG